MHPDIQITLRIPDLQLQFQGLTDAYRRRPHDAGGQGGPLHPTSAPTA
jgi:hypothetical protein